MPNKGTYFVDVILPIAIPQSYTYCVPEEFNSSLEIGKRVIVQFGKQKIYAALISAIHQNKPKEIETKNILSVLDEKPVINTIQLNLWKWLSDYYMCTIGEVMNAALPAGLKLSSQTNILLNPEFDHDYSKLDDKEYLLTEALIVRKALTLNEAEKIIEIKTVIPVIKSLIAKKVIIAEEELVETYKPKTETYIRLSDKCRDDKILKEIFDKLDKAPKQLELLMSFIHLTKKFEKYNGEIKKSTLLKSINSSDATLNSLVKKNIFESIDKVTDRVGFADSVPHKLFKLSEYQKKALNEINDSFEIHDVVLLKGVTSSGKTEIYFHLIEEVLKQGKQVLYLLPEIALTSQIINRLTKFFGNNVLVYHSRFNNNERVEIWNKVLEDNSAKIVLGARSAVFLPFKNLGLIIVDEEHENSYKQFEPIPRYHARDTAIYLAKLHKSKTLLGSATPAIESFYNARNNKYGLVEIHQRFGNIKLPEITIVDIKEERKIKRMQSDFSMTLLESIKETLANNEQVILFQNRRGFAPHLECDSCSWVPMCKNCDVVLTYHKQVNQMVCHYCGYSINPFSKCPACNDTNIKMRGTGTEKIEEELSIFFPQAHIARFDLDSTRKKQSYQRIISDFEDGRINILVGTQMITKGLDFENVSIVGIINADNMLNFPDFRAFERSFQLMSQVSGRAGRRKKQGKVIIQTRNPKHPVINEILHYNYERMYERELFERHRFNYPPYFRLIKITLKHRDKSIVSSAADYLAANLKKELKNRVLGPEFPFIPRTHNLFMKDILIKLEKTKTSNTLKDIIRKNLNAFKTIKNFQSVRTYVDVDVM
ncbi:MAG: primosomal protein N' [Bacteroidales bacterium]|nr:primosomal protein N' [Bacteroidales bacterium]